MCSGTGLQIWLAQHDDCLRICEEGSWGGWCYAIEYGGVSTIECLWRPLSSLERPVLLWRLVLKQMSAVFITGYFGNEIELSRLCLPCSWYGNRGWFSVHTESGCPLISCRVCSSLNWLWSTGYTAIALKWTAQIAHKDIPLQPSTAAQAPKLAFRMRLRLLWTRQALLLYCQL